jgi:hypothetical protein
MRLLASSVLILMAGTIQLLQLLNSTRPAVRDLHALEMGTMADDGKHRPFCRRSVL